jgi:filamentous hemagglutinin
MLEQPQYLTVVTSTDPAAQTLTAPYNRVTTTGGYSLGGANFLAGQDPAYAVLSGDTFAQLFRDVTSLPVGATVEAERHDGLHVGDTNQARIIALTGDVTSTLSGPPQGSGGSTLAGPTSTVVNLAKEAEVYAGRDIKGLELLGQNNSSNDVTSIVAGRDITYPTILTPFGPLVNGNPTFAIEQISAIEIGGAGNLVIEAGRNVDLGSSTGIQTFGNMLNPSLKTTAGANITIDTGLGSLLTLPAYSTFVGQYVDPATASANQYASRSNCSTPKATSSAPATKPTRT